MFKRILLTLFILLGSIIGISVGMTVAGPATKAHASGVCSSQYFSYEEDNVWIVSKARATNYNDVFLSDSYGTVYPSQVAPSPTGQWYYFGKWDLCWNVIIDDDNTYYAGNFAMYNQATGGWIGINSYANDLLTNGPFGYSYGTLWSYACYYGSGFDMVNQLSGYTSDFATYAANFTYGTTNLTNVLWGTVLNNGQIDNNNLMLNVGADNNPIFCNQG